MHRHPAGRLPGFSPCFICYSSARLRPALVDRVLDYETRCPIDRDCPEGPPPEESLRSCPTHYLTTERRTFNKCSGRRPTRFDALVLAPQRSLYRGSSIRPCSKRNLATWA